MASFTGQSLVSIDDDEKTANLYTEMNERFKIIKEKMEVLEENFKQLANISVQTDTVITPLMVALKENYSFGIE